MKLLCFTNSVLNLDQVCRIKRSDFENDNGLYHIVFNFGGLKDETWTSYDFETDRDESYYELIEFMSSDKTLLNWSGNDKVKEILDKNVSKVI